METSFLTQYWYYPKVTSWKVQSRGILLMDPLLHVCALLEGSIINTPTQFSISHVFFYLCLRLSENNFLNATTSSWHTISFHIKHMLNTTLNTILMYKIFYILLSLICVDDCRRKLCEDLEKAYISIKYLAYWCEQTF